MTPSQVNTAYKAHRFACRLTGDTPQEPCIFAYDRGVKYSVYRTWRIKKRRAYLSRRSYEER